MNIAFFDFDGTITRRDSMFDFLQFAVGRRNLIKGLILLGPMLILFKLKLISRIRAKENLLKYFLEGWTKKRIIYICKQYSETRLDKIIKVSALNRLQEHKKK